jgi:hypothetical protein
MPAGSSEHDVTDDGMNDEGFDRFVSSALR